MTHEIPTEDAITVCAFCATICKFDKDQNQIPLTDEEILAVALADPKKFALLIIFKEHIENMLAANLQ
jgi:hypothetical protein